eukprot:6141785-Amphidinium_carterae.1
MAHTHAEASVLCSPNATKKHLSYISLPGQIQKCLATGSKTLATYCKFVGRPRIQNLSCAATTTRLESGVHPPHIGPPPQLSM